MFILREVVNKVMDNTNILVSVICLTYNHEKYISRCLDGFVEQKTDFKFEVLVHDDASTDKTPDIVREYEKKYPDIIKPIYQNENKYSKTSSIIREYVLPKAKGKYIALCEGDDFWTDSLKLQKQFDALEKHKDCNMCVCTVRDADEDGTPMDTTHPQEIFDSCVLEPAEFIKVALKAYVFQTASYFCRTDLYCDFQYNPPQYRKIAPVGDWPMLLYFSQTGGVYYIKDEMACYRRNSIGSITTSMKKLNIEKQKKYYGGIVDMIKSFDECTDEKYHKDCEEFRLRFQKYYYDCLKEEKNYKELVDNKYRCFFKQESLKDKLYIKSKVYLPFVAWLYDKINN